MFLSCGLLYDQFSYCISAVGAEEKLCEHNLGLAFRTYQPAFITTTYL
jgi:hypothetical protein